MSDHDLEGEEQVGGNANTVLPPRGIITGFSSIIRRSDGDENPPPLWLITFTDAMALMLTFFVMMYSMSKPKEEIWNEISYGISSHFKQKEAAPYNRGSQDAISIDQVNTKKALQLDYVQSIVANSLKGKGIEKIALIQNSERLIISLPSELLFKSGQIEIGTEGTKMLFTLTGVLARLHNRVIVVGHSDPDPISAQTKGPYRTNWELSLARATSVAAKMRESGYVKEITVKGLSSGRFDELPEDIALSERKNLSRRVDIVVMNDDGIRQNAFDVP